MSDTGYSCCPHGYSKNPDPALVAANSPSPAAPDWRSPSRICCVKVRAYLASIAYSRQVTNPSPDVLRANLAELVRYRKEYLTGDEKGEAQVFCDRLFRAFGYEGVREAGATLEMRLRRNDAKGTAFADLLWRGRCLIEMKKAKTNLSRHYRQAFDYWIAAVPDRPHYVILCNFDELWVYDFDIQLDEPVDRLSLTDLPDRYEVLAFLLPQPERPIFGNDLVEVTRGAARGVARVFREIHARGISRDHAQRFVLQCVMAMFAEDIHLLPSKSFSRALEDSATGADAYDLIFGLFREMNTPGVTSGGRYRGTPYFNGGLFEDIAPLELTTSELDLLRAAAITKWSAVRPEIFGTLFEGSMDDGERHAAGAHFTSQADISKIVIPTVVTPWRERLNSARSIADLQRILGDMYSYRVLDPACGSGNFLYVAYREMRRLEHETLALIQDRRRSGDLAMQGSLTYVTPDHFFGIDRNPFAVEVAKVTMMLAKKLAADELDEDQVVLPLDNLDSSIVAADALFTPWPKVDAIIGNPPFMGRRKMIRELGADYTSRLAEAYPQIGGVSDFVTYWFPLAHDHLEQGGRAGLVATKTIRENASRRASLDYIVDHGGVITDAVSSQKWSGDAQVTVSIVNWIKGEYAAPKVLWINDDQLRLETEFISSSLMPIVDVRNANELPVNQEPASCFQGQTPGVIKGFLIDGAARQHLLSEDPNNESVIFPFLGGKQLLEKVVIGEWIIDIPFDDIVMAEAAVPSVMTHLAENVLPIRQKAANEEAERTALVLARNPQARVNRHHANFLNHWWQLGYRRAELLDAIKDLDRYIATSRYATDKRATIFAFVDSAVHPSDGLSVFALDDDYSLGILSSTTHRAWFEARCSRLETRLRYTSTTVWDSFPWPQAPSDHNVRAVSALAAEILRFREERLAAGISLKRQYDALRQPGASTLRQLHDALDRAVLDSYEFPADGDVVTQLLALNQAVAADPASARGPGGANLSGTCVSQYRISPPAI